MDAEWPWRGLGIEQFAGILTGNEKPGSLPFHSKGCLTCRARQAKLQADRPDMVQDARGMQTRLNAASPGNFPDVPEGGVIWVFAVK